MRFEFPILLWLAPGAALITLLLAWLVTARRLKLAAAWSARLAPLARTGRMASIILLALAAAAAGFGAAGPRGGRTQRSEGVQGLNVLIAVDVSRSMLAEDADPNRLHRAIREAQRLVQDLPSDRIGVVAFAGQAYLLSPLTLDHSAVRLYLETLDPDLASAGGTQVEPLLVRSPVLTGSRGGRRAPVVFTTVRSRFPELSMTARAPPEGSVSSWRAGRHRAGRIRFATPPARSPTTSRMRRAIGAHHAARRGPAGPRTCRRQRRVPADLPDQAAAIRDQLGALTRRPLGSGDWLIRPPPDAGLVAARCCWRCRWFRRGARSRGSCSRRPCRSGPRRFPRASACSAPAAPAKPPPVAARRAGGAATPPGTTPGPRWCGPKVRRVAGCSAAGHVARSTLRAFYNWAWPRCGSRGAMPRGQRAGGSAGLFQAGVVARSGLGASQVESRAAAPAGAAVVELAEAQSAGTAAAAGEHQRALPHPGRSDPVVGRAE